MTDIAAVAIKSSAWEGSNGIITEGASPTANNDGVGFKGFFVSLVPTYELLPTFFFSFASDIYSRT